MHAHGALRVEAGPEDRCRLTKIVESAPIGFRRSGDGVYLVGTAAGPLDSDQLSATVDVGEGASLNMRSTAASVLYAGSPSGSRYETSVTVAAGATLSWRLEPMIVTAGCRHVAVTHVWLDPSAELDWTEVLVCGREGERPGSLHLRLDIDVGESPLLRQGLVIGTDGPGWEGPAVLGDNRVLGMRILRVGPEGGTDQQWIDGPVPEGWSGDGCSAMRIDDRTVMVMAVGASASRVSARLSSPELAIPSRTDAVERAPLAS